MNKLKQVFSHDENKSPSGHFTAESPEQVHSSSHNQSTTGTHSTEGSSLTGNDVGTTPHSSSAAGTSSLNNSSSLNSSSSAPRENLASSSTATTGTHSHGVAGAAETLKEHAHPPHHTHNQPKRDSILSEAEAKLATHDHQHLEAVTHETRHHHEIEEVERQREIDRHVHHVQHHVQPVLDTQHAAEQHVEKVVPVTRINESHVATDEDKAQFAALSTARNTVTEAPREKTIIDKGEQVIENVSHHVHHVVQPEIERDTHEHHRIHTVIPVHQTTHEAPIVHSSVQHEPMSLSDFVGGGGDLSSKLKHSADLLLHKDSTDCERKVDGPAESLTQQLGLSSISGGKTNSAAYGENYGTSNLPAGEGRSTGAHTGTSTGTSTGTHTGTTAGTAAGTTGGRI